MTSSSKPDFAGVVVAAGRATRYSSGRPKQFEDLAGRFALPWIARNTPLLTPFVSRIASRLANEVDTSVQTASDAFHFQKAYPRAWDLSIAVPAQEAARAWREGIRLVNEYAVAGLYPVNLVLHCRITGGSSAWLAPNYGGETCYIEVVTIKNTPQWGGFFREMERRWLAIEGSRPHWAKWYHCRQEIADRYPRMGDFLEVRRRWDPARVFLNDFLEKEVFGLPEIIEPSTAELRSAQAGFATPQP